MKNHSTPWNRLVAGARLAQADICETAAPLGFAARVSALALAPSAEPDFFTLFARFSLRSLGVCGLLMLIGVSLNFSSVVRAFETESLVVNDPVTEWLNAAS